MKIIVIDDEISALSTFLPNILDDPAIDCRMFMQNPLSALDYLQKTPVDAAFLDIKMPDVDGVDLAEKMLSIKPDLKIVFISAYAENEKEICDKLKGKTVRFCHKPYRKESILNLIAEFKAENSVKTCFLKTFDAFDLFVNGIAVDFSSSKAKELLALLTDAKGSFVTMDTVIGNLWPDKNAELAKRLYRDAVTRLRLTLKDAGVENLVSFERGRSVINTQNVKCDMWDYVYNGGVFSGRYLPQYDWSVITESALIKLGEKRE